MLGQALIAIALGVIADAPAAGVADAVPLADAFLAAANGCADYTKDGVTSLTNRFAVDAAPAYVSEGAEEIKLGKPRYFHAPASNGDVWIVVFDGDPICMVQGYGTAQAEAETKIRASAEAAGWRIDDKVKDVVRGTRRISVYDTSRGGKRVQMTFLTPLSYQQPGASRPWAISGFIEAVEKGK